MSNSRPFSPTRRWRKITGRPESASTASDAAASSGAANTSAGSTSTRSSVRRTIAVAGDDTAATSSACGGGSRKPVANTATRPAPTSASATAASITMGPAIPAKRGTVDKTRSGMSPRQMAAATA